MTPAETTMLLTFLAGLDPRTAPRDDHEAKLRIAAWTEVLARYDYAECKAAVKRYYSTEQQWPMQIGQISAMCKPSAKWEDRPALTAAVGKPMPDEVRAAVGANTPDRRARKVPCPWDACKAVAFSPCVVEGEPMKGSRVHPARLEAARTAA